MTEIDQNATEPQGAEAPVSVKEILKENWVLARALIFFILMLAVPLIVAWKLDLFLTANN
ncbi:MAG TPA: hypothetical protein VJ600_05245 [Holophagaceae bacterium]|nr:hypothetical protein [Holophagaceae bacterium]